jgi:FkbM family methyltransferase
MIKLAQVLTKVLPPLLSQRIRNYIYPIEVARNQNKTLNKKSITGSCLKIDTRDYHGYRFFIHGFYDWRNVIIANSISKYRKGDIIEIGANIGTETVSFCDIVNSNGNVHAFEPLPNNIAKLKALRQTQNNLIIYELALSDKEDDVTFLIPPETSSGTGKIIKQIENSKNVLSIKTKPLDNFISKFKDVNFISIDTEGHEPFVLNGSKRTLKEHNPSVVIEVSPKLLKKYSNSTPKNIFQYFRDLDYEVFKVNKLSISKVKEKDLLGQTAINWLCIPKNELKIIKQVKIDLVLRSILPWFILKTLPNTVYKK